jgi:hypothetical protein
LVDQIKEIELGVALSTYERNEKMHAGFWWRNLKERLLEDLGADWSSYSSVLKRMPTI